MSGVEEVERTPTKKAMHPHVRDALSRFFVVDKSGWMEENERKKLQRTANFRLMLVSRGFLQTFRRSLRNARMTLAFGDEGGQFAVFWTDPLHMAARVRQTELTAIAGILQHASFGGLIRTLELYEPQYPSFAFLFKLLNRFAGVPRLVMKTTTSGFCWGRIRVLQALGPQLRELECPLEFLDRPDVPPLQLEKFVNREDVEHAVDLNFLFKHAIRFAHLRHVCGLFGEPPVAGSECATEELRLSFAPYDLCKEEQFDRLRALSSMPRLKKVSIEFGSIYAWSDGEYRKALNDIRNVARFARSHCTHVKHFGVGMAGYWDIERIAQLSFFADKQPSIIEAPYSQEDAAQLPVFEGKLPPKMLKWSDNGIVYCIRPQFMN